MRETDERGKTFRHSQKVVTVCDRCLTETCLRTSFKCGESDIAGTITDTEERIAALASTETD